MKRRDFINALEVLECLEQENDTEEPYLSIRKQLAHILGDIDEALPPVDDTGIVATRLCAVSESGPE